MHLFTCICWHHVEKSLCDRFVALFAASFGTRWHFRSFAGYGIQHMVHRICMWTEWTQV